MTEDVGARGGGGSPLHAPEAASAVPFDKGEAWTRRIHRITTSGTRDGESERLAWEEEDPTCPGEDLTWDEERALARVLHGDFDSRIVRWCTDHEPQEARRFFGDASR